MTDDVVDVPADPRRGPVSLTWFCGAEVEMEITDYWGVVLHPETISLGLLGAIAGLVVSLQLGLPVPAALVCGVSLLFTAGVFVLYTYMLKVAFGMAIRSGRRKLNASPLMILTIAVTGVAKLWILHSLAGVRMGGPQTLGVIFQWYCIAEAAFLIYASYTLPRIKAQAAAQSAETASAVAPQPVQLGLQAPEPALTPDVTMGTTVLRQSDILLLSAEDDYLRVTRNGGVDLIRARLKDVLPQLEVRLGVAVHRSHWVAFGYISSLRRLPDRQFEITLVDGSSLPIARARQQEVIRLLARRGIYIGETTEPPDMAKPQGLTHRYSQTGQSIPKTVASAPDQKPARRNLAPEGTTSAVAETLV